MSRFKFTVFSKISKNNFFIFLFFNSIFLVFLDLYSKFFVKNLIFNKCYSLYLKQYKYSLYYKCKIQIFSFLKFVYTENYGMVFGIFSELKYVHYVIPFIILIPLGLVFYMSYCVLIDKKITKFDKKVQLLFLSFIFSGGIGNAIDRIVHGFVFDFIDLYFKGYHWYTFNVADCFVCIGIIGLIISDIKLKIQNK